VCTAHNDSIAPFGQGMLVRTSRARLCKLCSCADGIISQAGLSLSIGLAHASKEQQKEVLVTDLGALHAYTPCCVVYAYMLIYIPLSTALTL